MPIAATHWTPALVNTVFTLFTLVDGRGARHLDDDVRLLVMDYSLSHGEGRLAMDVSDIPCSRNDRGVAEPDLQFCADALNYYNVKVPSRREIG